ncbi:MAG: tetratricopeptide repeat protein [bacterium]|nr:tetratricopeptide repeat protein [bacterium]
MPEEIPQKAKDSYNEAVKILQEDWAQRRTMRGTDIVINSLREAVKEYDGFFDAWRLLGEVYLGSEQPLEAYIALKKAHELKKENSEVPTLLGEVSLILGRPKLAWQYLELALAGENVPIAAKKLKALALARDERWQDSLAAFGEALAEDPSDGEMRRECAKVLSELGYNREAACIFADYLDPFRHFFGKQPAIVESGWIMKPGQVLDRLLPGASKRAAENETVGRPEDYRIWYDLGNVFLDGEEYESAAACYKRALRVHPDYYDALHNMGIALEELDRHDDALQMYEAAIEADPDTPEAYLSIAELLEDMDPEETDEIALNYLMYYRLDPTADGFETLEKELRARLEETPDIGQILLLSHVYLLRDEIDQADSILKLIESAVEGEATVQWLRGKILQERSQIKEAELAYRAGLSIVNLDEIEPTIEEQNIEARIRFDLAVLLEESARHSEALAVLEEDIDTLDSDGLCLLAELKLDSSPD